MKLPITTKDKIKNPKKGFGFAFIDSEDNKLKIKKIDGIIEFSNAQGDSGSTTDKQVLVLSGFSSSETAIYGVDLNGEYVLVSADVPSYDRVWVCEANGVQLMYKSAWGYWALLNSTASGGNTYTYGDGNNPYKADGSSAQWQTQGANISATAVVKGSNNGGDTGGGDTPGVTYLYTVSGSSRAEVNGDYWQDGTKNGKGKYTNGSCDMVWIGSYWAIGPIGYNGSGAPYHACWEDIATPISSSWSGVTVTEYAGNSGEGGGDTATKVIITKNGSYNYAIDGTFVDNGNGRYVREGDSADYYYYIEWYDGGWRMFDNQGNFPNGYANFGGTQDDITSIAGTQSPYWNHESSPYEVTITVTTGDSSDSESGSGDNPSSLSIDFTDNSGFYGSYTDMLAGDYAYDSSVEAYRNAGNSTAFGVIKWFDSPPSWGNGNDNGGSGVGWYLCSYNSDNTIKDMFYNLKGTSGDINSITAGSYTGNYTMFADSGYTFSFTVTFGNGSGGSTAKADYTVSGAGTEVVNGDYVAYESSWTSYKHTTNDIWLWYDSNLMKWYICMTGPGITGVAEVYYETPADCPDPTTASWFTSTPAGSDPAPTITQGGSSNGGSTDGQTQTLIVSGFNSYYSGADGEYMLTDANATGTARVWTHKDNSSTKIHFSGGSWTLGYNGAAGGDLYTSSSAENPYDTDWYWCGSAALSNVSVTVAGGSSSDSEDNTETVAYLVSNDGFTGDLAKYAGTYTQTNATAAGTSAIYKNENNCYMYWHGTTWGWVFSSSEGGYPDVITYETSDDPTQATNKGYWYNESTVTEMQPGTVTLVGNGSGGGESGSGTGALFRVSGAGSTEANGDYFDTGETKNNLPIYKNENNIYMYFSTQCGYSWAPGWCLSPTVIDEGSGMLYCTFGNNADTYPTDMLISWGTLDGVSPTPVCRKLDENGNEIIPADYTVTGAGTEAVNGEYFATGNYISGTNGAIYKHKTNDVYLFGNGSNCFFAFEAVYSPAYYYTCETYSYDIQTGDWANATYPSCGSGETPYPTVTKKRD